MTVTLSLFGFGWLIDEFVYNSESVESEENHPHQVLLNGFVNHLGNASADTLITRVKTLSVQFNVNLVLERREDFAFEKDVFDELDTLGLQLASEHGLYYLKPIPKHPEYLLKLTAARNTEGNRSLELTLTLLLYFGVSVAVVLWMYPLIKRLKKLTSAANKFGKGNLSARVVPAKLSQINVLEESFNKMASQIEHLIEENRLLANSLSHDLRTPVACFRFALDACLDEPDVERKNEYLMRMEKDVENIEGMLKAFLDYASMERQGMQLVFRLTNMIGFLQTVVNDLQPIAKKKGLGYV